MPRVTRSLAVAAMAAALTGFAAPVATADPPSGGDPCAKQEAHLARAQDALARVSAVFAKQKQHVDATRSALAHANTHAQHVHAQQALAHALGQKDKAKSAKKAQQQRVAKDQQRLTQCQAASSTS